MIFAVVTSSVAYSDAPLAFTQYLNEYFVFGFRPVTTISSPSPLWSLKNVSSSLESPKLYVPFT